MQFRILGPVSVTAGDEQAAVGRGHQRTILAVLLAAAGETIVTERLAEAVWAGQPPPSARKSLQSHIARLRAELRALALDQPDPVVTEAAGYRIDLDAHDLDARRFEHLVQQARGVRQNDVATAAALLAEAESCWSGPAFGDLADHPGIRTAARHMEQLRAAATADRLDAWLDMGRHQEAVGELLRIVEDARFDERAHGQLMRALVLAGRPAEALTVFRDVQLRLRAELGADPSSQLRQIHEQVLRQDPTLAARSATVAEPPVRAHGRPSATNELLGRDHDVQTLTGWLRERRLVTLTGPGGVGKTRLAERVVERSRTRFCDGVVTCALAHVRDERGVAGALITALGIQPTGGYTASETLVSALGDRELLLFLDNCEHVLDAVTPPVAAILAGCPNVTVMATSRERLRLASEHLWPVSPLQVPPDTSDAEQVLATSAGALFRLRAEAAVPGFTVTEDNAGAVAELCRRLDGMPLAIELAAARTRALAPADLARRLDRRFAVLSGGPRHEAGRHRTLEAVVAWSYDLLTPPEAELFERLSVFAGVFPLDAAEEVCGGRGLDNGAVAGLLGELVDKSMVAVQRTGGQVRYRLLDTMREFGMQRLSDRGTVEQVRTVHATYHVALAEARGRQARGAEEPTAVAAIDAAFDDLRAAHAWLVAVGDVAGALRLPAALMDEVFFRLRDEVTTWARRALALPGAAEHPAYPAALATAAMGATSRDQCERAGREAAEALSHTEPRSPVAVRALAGLATVALYEGRLEDVLRLAGRQADVAVARGDDYRAAYAGVLRTLAHLYRGERPAAVAHVADLRQVAEASGNATMRAFARYCDGEAHLDVQPDEAARTLEEAVALARSVNNQLIEGVSLVCLASLQGRRGRSHEALRLFRDVVAHWRRLGNRTHQLTTLRNLIELLAHIEADRPAAVLYGAVTAGGTPTFGAEAQRLQQAWRQVERRLGAEESRRLADRGRELGQQRLGDEAISQLDALLR